MPSRKPKRKPSIEAQRRATEPTVDNLLGEVKDQQAFAESSSAPWNQPGFHAAVTAADKKPPKPKPRPAPLPPKPTPPPPSMEEDIQAKEAEVKAARNPWRKTGVAVDIINTGAGSAAAKQVTDAADAKYRRLLAEEKKIDPNGAEARARKRMR